MPWLMLLCALHSMRCPLSHSQQTSSLSGTHFEECFVCHACEYACCACREAQCECVLQIRHKLVCAHWAFHTLFYTLHFISHLRCVICRHDCSPINQSCLLTSPVGVCCSKEAQQMVANKQAPQPLTLISISYTAQLCPGAGLPAATPHQ